MLPAPATPTPAATATSPRATSSGLEGVVVAETRMSDVDGERGRLVLRGHAVEDLAPVATFEDACALFLDVDAATAHAKLGAARVNAANAAGAAGAFTTGGDAMEALRAALALPGSEDPWEAIGLCAVTLARFARGSNVVADASAGHARDLLRMIRGAAPSDAEVRALDTYLVTVIDHGMNASTFAARVVASTGSDLRSCLCAGVGALKGPLHGGAPGPVLDMLDAIGAPERAAVWIEAALDDGKRVMGMGHRIYRVRDPRAFVLERALGALASDRVTLARAVEKTAEDALARRHPDRPLKANVEFFTAVLLDAIGVDRALFSAMFACARVVGWCAHVGEQRQVGRLIRPSSRFVG